MVLMKKVKYIGKYTAGVTIVDGGVEIDVEHSTPIDVDDDLAVRLCEQKTNWAPVGWKLSEPAPTSNDDVGDDDAEEGDD